jgi:hypothetical protein
MPPYGGAGFDATIFCGVGKWMSQYNKLPVILLLGNIAMNLIHLGTLVSRMIFPTHIVGKPILFFLFHASTIIVLGLRGSMFIVIIFIFILILLPRLLRIIRLCGFHQIHLIGMNESLSILGGGCNN